MNTKEKPKIKKQFNDFIKQISQGEKRALEDFYRAYGKLIYSVSLSVSKSHFLADEIVNDVLTKIWQNAKAISYVEKPSGWLYTVTKNCALDRIKREKQVYEIFDMLQNDINLEKLETDDSFNFYISRLNEDEQQIFMLKFIQDLSFKQIAKELDKPYTTVTSTYYRAIEKLKTYKK